jgi:hypothetical protein
MCLDHPLDETCKVFLGACVANPSADSPGGDADSGDQGLGAVALVFELDRYRLGSRHRQIRSDPLQCLDPGHLISAHDQLVGALCGLLIQGADVGDPLVLAGVRLGVEPISNAVGLERFF